MKFEGNREVKRTMITVFDEVGAFVWMVVLQLLRIAEKMRYRASRWVLVRPSFVFATCIWAEPEVT
jgi:hypothetical protein